MNLQRLNNKLTTGMIGSFISIIPLSLLSLVFPIISYILVIAIFILMFFTIVSFITTTIWFIVDINKLIENFFKHYDPEREFK